MTPTTQVLDILRCDNLGLAFSAKQVLAGISLAMPEHQVTAIIGPSGSGKSTFLKALNRTLELTPGARITRGDISCRGASILDARQDLQSLRKRIGLIHQTPVPFPMSIMENVLFGVRFHGHWCGRSPEQAAREHLEQAGLWDEVKDRLHEPAGKLSGGQQQRLCIARTLANQPEIILMDEPCSALDPHSSAQIEELILKLKGSLTFVMVTHNLAQARRVADRVALFWTDNGPGHLIEEGATEQMFARPMQELTAAYISGSRG
jgi:phosphate transport system ATP-binding protein